MRFAQLADTVEPTDLRAVLVAAGIIRPATSAASGATRAMTPCRLPPGRAVLRLDAAGRAAVHRPSTMGGVAELGAGRTS